MDEKQLSEIIAQKIAEWKQSQEGQKDGYEYEKTFDKMMQEIGKSILQESIGKVPESRKLKKK